MPRIKIPKPVSGGVLLSYRCSAQCRHCMYACSPYWKGDWISIRDLEECLSQLAGSILPSPWGPQRISLNHGLHFTGGEPFLNFEVLARAVEIAESLRIPSTFVETNCSWCVSNDTTTEKLELLKQKGLEGILISVNPFYAEYVPFERTERCIEISARVFGKNVMVYQREYYVRFRQLGIKEKLSVEEYLDLAGNESLTEHVELFLMGRAACQLRDLYPLYPAHRFFGAPCRPPFLREWHNHFDNYGNIVPGYCGGISLGNWKDLERLTEEGIDLEAHRILGFLIAEDIQGLCRFAKGLGYHESKKGYCSKCDLCLDIRKYLVSKNHFKELSPEEFYAHSET